MEEEDEDDSVTGAMGAESPQALVGVIKGALERCKAMKVPPELFVRTVEAGVQPDDVLEFLEAASKADLPGADQGVAYALRILIALVKDPE